MVTSPVTWGVFYNEKKYSENRKKKQNKIKDFFGDWEIKRIEGADITLHSSGDIYSLGQCRSLKLTCQQQNTCEYEPIVCELFCVLCETWFFFLSRFTHQFEYV